MIFHCFPMKSILLGQKEMLRFQGKLWKIDLLELNLIYLGAQVEFQSVLGHCKINSNSSMLNRLRTFLGP